MGSYYFIGWLFLKIFRNFGIVVIAIFSFFYTEKIAELTLEKNELYQSIAAVQEEYSTQYVNAVIDDEYITPGLNGKVVNIKDSYYNMKDINTFNAYYLLYDTAPPEITIDNNKDKIIKQGNSLKNSVAFVIDYDEELIAYFTKLGVSVSVCIKLDEYEQSSGYEQINCDMDNYKDVESLLNRHNSNTDICFLNNANEEVCRENNKYLVKSENVVNNSTFLSIKDSISSGDIYYLNKNIDTKSLNVLINSIMYKDLDIVYLSKLISEEID